MNANARRPILAACCATLLLSNVDPIAAQKPTPNLRTNIDRPLRYRPDGSDYVIDVWGASRGLPGNSATAIAQTPEGYLWVGTFDGLARFDGVRFVRFDPTNTPVLKNSRIERLFTDAAGTLWINTHDGSLIAWRNGVFTSEWAATERVETGVWLARSTAEEQVFVLQTGKVIRRSMSGGQPGPWTVLQPDRALFGTTFCVTRSGEIWIRSRDERIWRIARGAVEPIALGDQVKGGSLRALAVDSEERVAIGTDREIARWNGVTFERILPQTTGRPMNVEFLHFTKSGDFWAVIDGRLRKGRDRTLTLDAGPTRYLAEDILQAQVPIEDRRGGIWFAHGGAGLLHVAKNGAVRRFGANEGFISGRIVGLFKDREENVWVSVDRGGLARVRERRFDVVRAGDERAAYAVVSVAEGPGGDLWMGSAGGGLLRYRDGRADAIPLPPSARPFVLSLIPEGERLWMSADREDLWLLEKGVARPAPQSLHGIKALLVDRAGNLWIGRRDGLDRVTKGAVEHFGPERGMATTDIRALAEDSAGSIWIGGGDGSLHRFQDGRIEKIRLGLPTAYPIWSLFGDPDGSLWAGTYQGGLLHLENGTVTRYTAREGLASDLVCQIQDDDLGNLWIGSREGLSRVSKKNLDAVGRKTSPSLSPAIYGRAEAIPPLDCSGYQPGSWRTESGKLWFATTNGAVSVTPSDLGPDQIPPSVIIEGVTADRASIAVPAEPEAHVVVPAGSRVVEFQFTGISLAAPEGVRFRYRLADLESEFVDVSDRRTAAYSYLPPGNYRFEVMARNSDGVWSAPGTAVAVTVLPRAWETWWFRTALAGLALMIAAGIARQIATRDMRRNLARVEQQRAIERDRARIAKDIHDDLGAGLTQISLLSELLRDDSPHEAKVHVDQIGETAAELTRAMDEIVWAVNPSEDTLESLWDYLSHFAHEYLGAAGIACRLEAPSSIPVQSLRAEVRHNVFLAVKEALNNVVKHAAASEVRLRLDVRASGFVVEVTDDGHGMIASTAPTKLRTATGHGLRNLAERLTSIGGRCEITPGSQGGTRVRLEVPLS